jgi:hypothetical protein
MLTLIFVSNLLVNNNFSIQQSWTMGFLIMLKIKSSATWKINEIFFLFLSKLLGGNFCQMATCVWNAGACACLASGHAGEADPVHGGAHKVLK